MRAAVLAAGRGLRMGGRTPKTLLPVPDREPLLFYVLTGLARAGIRDLLVVTGFKREDVEAYVAKEWEGEAVFAFNARYASWGNFHSVRMALDQSPGHDVLVVNSDIAVPPYVYARVASSPGDLVLAVQRRGDLDAEDMRVELRGDEVRAVSKDLPAERSHGEFAGVSLLRSDAARRYCDVATELEWRADTHHYYEDVYARILGALDVRAAGLEEGDYAEVDSPEDFPAAARVIDRHRDAWNGEP